MTAETIAPPEVKLPKGVAAVVKRARAAGFRVSIARGNSQREVSVREHLYREDGTPELTEKGRQHYITVKRIAPAYSIGLHLQHDEAQQGQCGWWTGDEASLRFDKGWAWPADGSDCRRRVKATQLGTLVDLDQLREASLARAEAELAKAEARCRCMDHHPAHRSR